MVNLDIEGSSRNIRLEVDNRERRSWLAFGLWLYAIVAAVGIFATGIASLLERHSTQSGLVLTFAGAALAGFAWHRSRAALVRVNAAGQAAGVADLAGPAAARRSAFASRATMRPERA
jgi:hypothetical protein